MQARELQAPLPAAQPTFSRLPPSPACFSRALLLGSQGKHWEGGKYPPPGTCPLKELGPFGRIFLPYAHFSFLPSTLLLTRISPSPLRCCRSHVVPIFLQENPSNPSRQLGVWPVLEQLWRVGRRARPQGLVPSFPGGSSPGRGLAGAGPAPAIPAGKILRQSNQAPPPQRSRCRWLPGRCSPSSDLQPGGNAVCPLQLPLHGAAEGNESPAPQPTASGN